MLITKCAVLNVRSVLNNYIFVKHDFDKDNYVVVAQRIRDGGCTTVYAKTNAHAKTCFATLHHIHLSFTRIYSLIAYKYGSLLTFRYYYVYNA